MESVAKTPRRAPFMRAIDNQIALEGELSAPTQTAPALWAWLSSSAGLLIVKVASVLVAAGSQVLLAQWLGVEQFGVLVSIQALLAVALLLAKVGYEPVTVRFVGAYRAAEEFAALAGFRRHRFKLVLAVNGVIFAGGTGILTIVGGQISPVIWWGCLAALVALPLAVVTDIAAAELRGVGQAKRSEAIATLVRPLLVVVLTGVAVYLGASRGATTGMVAVVVGYGVSCGVMLWVGGRGGTEENARRAGSPSHDRERSEWRSAALLFTWIAGCQAVMAQADTLLLGVFGGPEQAAIFAAALRVSQLASLGLLAVIAISAPVVAGLFARARREELQTAAFRMAVAASVFTLPAVAALVVGGRLVLSWFGSEFEAGYVPLLILLAGQTINALCGAGAALLGMTGRHVDLAIAQTTGAIAKVGLLMVVIPVWGIVGAAWVWTGCAVIANAIMVVMVARHLGVNSTVFPSMGMFAVRRVSLGSTL
jgi:O-antigen/teichoic acid export membrane protein